MQEATARDRAVCDEAAHRSSLATGHVLKGSARAACPFSFLASLGHKDACGSRAEAAARDLPAVVPPAVESETEGFSSGFIGEVIEEGHAVRR